jgi:lysophospholipase L1-like esterase
VVRSAAQEFVVRHFVARFAIALGLVSVLAVAPSPAQSLRNGPRAAATVETWVDSWAASFLPTTINGTLRTTRTFENQTLRLNVFAKLGGRMARVELTNRFTDVPLVVGAAHIAMRMQGAAIDPATDRALTFGGLATVTIPPGERCWSDPVPFVVTQHADVAISVFVQGPYRPTGFHAAGLKTSYVGTGNLTAEPSFPPAGAAGPGMSRDNGPTTDAVFLVSGLQVLAPSRARVIVAFGDSITDGAASDTDANGSWPDVLSMRLPHLADGTPVAVINMGIGSNRFVSAAQAGPTGTERFENDVLARPNVTHLILMQGINDISYEHVSAETLIAAYKAVITRAHARRIKVILATLLPIQKSVKDTPENIATQQAVNRWIRAGEGFDGVIDFEKIVQDPQNPLRIRAELTGDYVHPNTRGYRLMGEAVDLGLFGR